MATEYDARRPRLPKDLAARVDAARGQVPFNRFVVEALEKALASRSPDSGESSVVAAPASSRASQQAPFRKPFVPRPKGS